MIAIKFVDAVSDGSKTVATVKTKFGTFTGIAKRNPDDRNNENMGKEIATFRAKIAALQARNAILAERNNAIYNLFITCTDFDSNYLVDVEKKWIDGCDSLSWSNYLEIQTNKKQIQKYRDLINLMKLNAERYGHK